MKMPIVKNNSITTQRVVSTLIAIASLVTFVLFAYSNNFKDQRPVPEMVGDVFGYTNMARAITAGKLFGDLTSRPYLDDLLDHLRGKGFAFEDYYETLSPYAYHLDDLSHRIINQYPPGTGFLLTILPLEYRLYWFPSLVVLLFFLVSVSVLPLLKLKLSWLYVNAILAFSFCLIILDVRPFYLFEVNSFAPTYGFLVAAGVALVLRPNWSYVLLGMSSLFRVSSITLTLPFLFINLYLSGHEKGSGFSLTRKLCSEWIIKAAKAAGLFCIGGYTLYLLYVWILTGSPIHPTYPFYDREFSDIPALLINLRSYFSFRSPYLIFDLISIGLVGLLTWNRSKHWLIFSIALFFYNYLFFILHRVWVLHYVYASALVNLGVALAHLYKFGLRLDQKQRTLVNWITSALIFFCLLFTMIRLDLPDGNPTELYRNHRENYSRVFTGYDVIWSHMRGGTIEYLLDKPTLNYNDGSQAVKDEILLWMHNHGYRQAIWLNDIDQDLANGLGLALRRLQLPYRIRKVDQGYFGHILEIDPRRN